MGFQREQQQSSTLNIITGCHIIDKYQHILILEGLADVGVTDLWNHLPKEVDSDIKVMYNSDARFAQRLYGNLDLDIMKIKVYFYK